MKPPLLDAIEQLQPLLLRLVTLLQAALPATPLEVPAPFASVDPTPSAKGIRLVGAAVSYRKPAVPSWPSSTQYQFVKRAGVWIETCREDPFAACAPVAARATETALDPGRVQWDG